MVRCRWLPRPSGGTIGGMRWTDLPGDPEPAGGRDRAVVRRGEWEDLRRRLERLPAGHPSAPDDRDDAAADGADAGWAEDSRADEGRAGRGSADEAGEQPAERGGRAEPDRRARPEGSTRPEGQARPEGSTRPEGQEARRSAGLDRREPYRPWFTSGESPDPWFWADPDA
jgi:hypothetical protein